MSRIQEAQVVYAPDQPSQPWRNGGGQTRELLLWPKDSESWRIRISLARIERDGPFSEFRGIERWFKVIQGAGVVLRFDSQSLTLDEQSAPLCFDGGHPPDCALTNGPTSDLNLMCRKGQGALLAARSGLPWHSPAPHRGLFTSIDGIWHDPSGQQIELRANTLLWCQANPGVMVFNSHAESTGPAGFWLSYQPEDHEP